MLLNIENLETFIGQYHILQGVTIAVPEGGVTVILGRNGAGKTVTLRSIMGLNPPARGRVELGGELLNGLPPHVIARKGIGYVPENQEIFSDLTVDENLRLAMHRADRRTLARLDHVLELFPDLGVCMRRKGGALSGGQKQMLAIARALVNDNRLLLVDEPSKGLAPIIVQKVRDAILEIKREATVVLVEQNFSLAGAVGDRYYIIDDGRTVCHGRMDDLIQDEGLKRRYLGITGEGVH